MIENTVNNIMFMTFGAIIWEALKWAWRASKRIGEDYKE